MPQYARSSAGIVIICDVSSRLTVDGVRTWKMEADKVLVNGPPCILLVNKVINWNYNVYIIMIIHLV